MRYTTKVTNKIPHQLPAMLMACAKYVRLAPVDITNTC